MKSIHDNNVYAISIQCEEKVIILHTEYHHADPPEYTDILFDNAIFHHFEHVREGNILLDIEEADPTEFYNDHGIWLKNEQKFGVPISVESVDQFVSHIKTKGLKIYIINPSYGMWGWVICLKIKYKTKENKMPLA
jgi:hypothetical protein